MFFASEKSQTELKLYQALLNQYVSGQKNRESKNLIDRIIIDTRSLIRNEKQGFEIDHSIYHIVIPMYESIKEYGETRKVFEEIDPEDIKSSDYETIKNFLVSIVSNSPSTHV